MSRADVEGVVDGHEHDLVMPGFRFHPTEEELIEFYLRRKVEGKRFNVELIAFLDLYRHDPWELPALALVGEKEWFFYVPRDRKYRNGDRPNRVTKSGYWKATGAGRAVRAESGRRWSIGVKKTLVFYSGKAPKGVRTSWIMNEYRLPQSEVERNPKADISLCRVYSRAGVEDRHRFSGTAQAPASKKQATSSNGGSVPEKRRCSSSHDQRPPGGFQPIITDGDDAPSSPPLKELQVRVMMSSADQTNTPTSSSSAVIPVPTALYGSATATSLSPATSTDQEDTSTPPALQHQSSRSTRDHLLPTSDSPYIFSSSTSPAFGEVCRLANLNQMMMSTCMNQQPSHLLIQVPSLMQSQQLRRPLLNGVSATAQPSLTSSGSGIPSFLDRVSGVLHSVL